MKTTYHRGPRFDKWLLLAQSVHQIWVAPEIKDPFFARLQAYQVAEPGPLLQQASRGVATITTSVFIHCLLQAGCHTIRLKAYGQKTPLGPRFVNNEPGSVDHKWAVYNEWDIGMNFASPYIWLFESATGRRHGITHYPMMVPGSRDFGTVKVVATHRQQRFDIKIYPRIVHVIKSFNSRLQGMVPRTLHGVGTQVTGAIAMIHNLSSKDAGDLGGFRIEVTVKAKTLEEGAARVRETPFMNPSYWLAVGDGVHSPLPLNARLLSKKNFLDNASWVQQKAADDEILDGNNNDKPTCVQIQVLTDILNSLGWNSGLRRPTKWSSNDAWWNSSAPPPSASADLLANLNQRCQSDAEFKLLFQLARAQAGSIPCKKEPRNDQHRYQSNSPSPFRLRCGFRGCNSKLQRSAIIQWIVVLVEDRFLDGEQLMDQLDEAEAEEEEDEGMVIPD